MDEDNRKVTTKWANSCRLCLLNDGIKLPIFEGEGIQRQIARKIRTCFPILIYFGDPLPKMICHKCLFKLDTVYDFRQKCLEAHNILKKQLLPLKNESIVKRYLDQLENGKVSEKKQQVKQKSVPNSSQLKPVEPSIEPTTSHKALPNAAEVSSGPGNVFQEIFVSGPSTDVFLDERLSGRERHHSSLNRGPVSAASTVAPINIPVEHRPVSAATTIPPTNIPHERRDQVSAPPTIPSINFPVERLGPVFSANSISPVNIPVERHNQVSAAPTIPSTNFPLERHGPVSAASSIAPMNIPVERRNQVSAAPTIPYINFPLERHGPVSAASSIAPMNIPVERRNQVSAAPTIPYINFPLERRGPVSAASSIAPMNIPVERRNQVSAAPTIPSTNFPLERHGPVSAASSIAPMNIPVERHNQVSTAPTIPSINFPLERHGPVSAANSIAPMNIPVECRNQVSAAPTIPSINFPFERHGPVSAATNISPMNIPLGCLGQISNSTTITPVNIPIERCGPVSAAPTIPPANFPIDRLGAISAATTITSINNPFEHRGPVSAATTIAPINFPGEHHGRVPGASTIAPVNSHVQRHNQALAGIPPLNIPIDLYGQVTTIPPINIPAKHRSQVSTAAKNIPVRHRSQISVAATFVPPNFPVERSVAANFSSANIPVKSLPPLTPGEHRSQVSVATKFAGQIPACTTISPAENCGQVPATPAERASVESIATVLPDITIKQEPPDEVTLEEREEHEPVQQVTNDISPPVETRKNVECQRCKSTFEDEKQLESHECKPSSSQWSCEYCNKIYRSRDTLHKHRKYFCAKRRSGSECKFCGKLFGSELQVVEHQIVHLKVCVSLLQEDLHPCIYCGKRFSTKSMLELHKKLHYLRSPGETKTHVDDSQSVIQNSDQQSIRMPEKRFHCPQCPRSYAKKQYLTFHIKNAHFLENIVPNMNRLTEEEDVPQWNKQCSCKYCGDLCANSTELWLHMLQEHSSGGSVQQFRCDKCGRSFDHRSSYENHKRTHGAKLRCRACGKLYATTKALRAHEVNKHDLPTAKHHCRLCGESFTTRSAYLIHGRQHDIEKGKTLDTPLLPEDTNVVVGSLSCTLCSETFESAADLLSHMKNHSISGAPKDATCDNGEAEEKEQNTSLALICKICSRSFSSKGGLQRHIKTHATGKHIFYPCSVCGKKFVSESTFKAHVGTHTVSRSFHCPHCNKIFFKEEVFKSHACDGNEKEACATCGVLLSGEQLLNHVCVENVPVTETDEQMQCSVCPSTFSSLKALKSHMRLHNSEQGVNDGKVRTSCIKLSNGMYQCKICGMLTASHYGASSHYKIHINPHTKPYCCPFCGRRYTSEKTLYTHISAVHPDLPS